MKAQSAALVGDVLLSFTEGGSMFLVLFFILLVVWALGWGAFHVAGGLIHLLLIVAVVSLILHFVRGGRTTV